MISVDEKPGMQATERCHPSRAVAPGRSARYEFEYKRHGTQTLIAGFVVHTGEVLAACGDMRNAAELVSFMEGVAQRLPDKPIHVIWDNLNIHYDGKDERWSKFNERHGQPAGAGPARRPARGPTAAPSRLGLGLARRARAAEPWRSPGLTRRLSPP